MNASAVVIFCFFPGVGWRQGLALAIGAVMGGLLGSWALRRVPDKALRVVVVIIGVALTIGLFVRGA